MAKAKGKEKPAASDVPVETEVVDDATAEDTLSEPVEMEVTAEPTDTVVAEPDDVDAEESEKEPEEAEDEEEPEEDGPVDAEMTADAKEVEKVEEESKTKEDDGNEKVDSASNKKTKKNRKKKKPASNNATATNNSAKTGTPSAEKGKKADGMGLIFMCSSKTKQDCYRYNVFGLPKNQKDLVQKVYKGMRLFLYDIDLKLMYGIYKAASPGGYDLEPEAFRSQFPSQVRFTVLNDCKPLPEEKFKAAIKANYSARNKFNPQLTPEQVKNLCKLFMAENKAPVAQKRGGVGKGPISARREQTRRPPPRGPWNNDRYPRAPAVYPADTYASPPGRSVFRAPPPTYAYERPAPPTYAYERPAEDYYRRELPPPVYHDPRIGEPRHYEPIGYDRDPYNIYREPAPFREPPVYPSLSSAYGPPPPLYRY